MNPRRVVFDTNILLSAFLFGGKPRALFEAVHAGKIKLLTSPSILAEFASMPKNKFSWDDEDIHEALTAVGRHSGLVKPKKKFALLDDDAELALKVSRV